MTKQDPSQAIPDPDLERPVQRAGSEDLVVMGVPGDGPHGAGVGVVAREGVCTRCPQLQHLACVDAHEHVGFVIWVQRYAGGSACGR